jgi:glucosamine--fructose-6-phosphate aminotransferase (isomerizing)
MCGIFAYSGKEKKAVDLIFNGLKTLEYRGYDSWGIAAKKEDGTIFLEKHTGIIGNAKLPQISSSIGLGHTRWATHGGVFDKNAHPHTNKEKTVISVHNGIVENFSELKEKLIIKGYTFISDTDSEVIPNLIDFYIHEEKLSEKKATVKCFQQLHGMNAFIVFFPASETFYAIKNGSPLVYSETENEHFIASDASALAKYTTEVYYMNDNELLEITRSGGKLYTPEFKEIFVIWTKLPYTAEDTSIGDYEHFMLKEIEEQPKILTSILETKRRQIEQFAKTIEKAYGTYFIGCGTSYYAAMAAVYMFSKIAKRHTNAAIGSEFNYMMEFITNKSLIIALSQSGETIDILSSIKHVTQKKASIAAITNVIGSSLYRQAHTKILLDAGPEQSVCATKSFTATIAIIYLLSHVLDGGYRNGEVALKGAIKAVEDLLEKKEMIKKLAVRLKDHKNIFILGRGVSYPIAMESALKIKEVSYLHAEGFAGGELKHGVIALIEKGTPVIIYNPDDETYEDTISSAYEVKARGAYVIGLSSRLNPIFDEWIPVDVDNEAAIIPYVVVSQLIGYYIAVAKGLNPDKPRNLAKSVTVK